MITPIRTMKINDICQRKDDLLMSADDIEEIAKNVRAKAIDEFAKKLKKKYPLMENGLFSINDMLRKTIDDIAEQMKAGVENGNK